MICTSSGLVDGAGLVSLGIEQIARALRWSPEGETMTNCSPISGHRQTETLPAAAAGILTQSVWFSPIARRILGGLTSKTVPTVTRLCRRRAISAFMRS